jgi:hypothetical protein
VSALREHVLGPIIERIARLQASGTTTEALDVAKRNLDLVHQLAAGRERASIQRAVFILCLARLAVTDLLIDEEAPVAAAVEIAFAHLKRSLVVDEHLRQRWVDAWSKKRGEIACERLGGMHLLQHGLWAFKTDATGERADLVLGEHASKIDPTAIAAARGLVPTEWKTASEKATPARVEKLAAEARSQLADYAGGHLAGVELRRIRYAVIVSKHEVPLAPEVSEGDFVVRQINIAVTPRSPSKRARSR